MSTSPYLHQTIYRTTAGPSAQPYSPYYPSAFYNYPWKNNAYWAGAQQPYFAQHPAIQHPQNLPEPSSSPSPTFYKHWDEVVLSFLRQIGFKQAVIGFEADMLVLNEECERKTVPSALKDLIDSISLLGNSEDQPMHDDSDAPATTSATASMQVEEKVATLDVRKLDYVLLSENAVPRSQSSINKEISLFLSKNRGHNDASNRSEFLYSTSEKRHRLQEEMKRRGQAPSANLAIESLPSCARVDVKPVDRDVQIKYDIAKNEDGPLRRTVEMHPVQDTREGKKGEGRGIEGSVFAVGEHSSPLTVQGSLALDERLRNIEAHLAVKYVPSPPSTLLGRLKCLEEHIICLEKDYPPWAALHFNQPNRGWPPPPRLTPIIVPPQMRLSPSTPSNERSPLESPASTMSRTGFEANTSTKARGSGTSAKTKTVSSLHRAVMDKLEVRQAMQDLTRGSG